jgi:hypothetical protein
MLLSDVDIPLLSGPDLGETLKKARPDMHVMLMSGERKEVYWFSITVGPSFRSPLYRRSWLKWSRMYLHSRNRSQLGGQEFDSRKHILKDSPHRDSAVTTMISLLAASERAELARTSPRANWKRMAKSLRYLRSSRTGPS